MWHQSFSTQAQGVNSAQIWKVLTDINHWGDWDSEIESMDLQGEAVVNADFFLKPKGGPKTKLTITKMESPTLFEDVAHLPMAKMYTTHTLTDTDNGVNIALDIKVTGLLSFLWVKVIAKKQIEGAAEQIAQLVNKARSVQ